MKNLSIQTIYHALERNELELYYQPQIDSQSDRIVGLEALLRWKHPKKGIIGPLEFIQAIENTGLIMKISEWVVKSACRQNKYWQDMGLPKKPVAVNISARQLEDGDIVELFCGALKETGLPSEYIEIEITENTAVRDFNIAVETLKRLKNLGVGIAMDDFGASYSSLNYIKQLPVDAVKIDKCFIEGIGVSIKDEAILKTVIALLQNFNLRIVAEGVETEQQVKFLADEGCRIIQGFYYYKPMPADDIEKLLSSENKNFDSLAKDTVHAVITDTDIGRYLEAKGIRHSHTGYRYLFTAIRLGVDEHSQFWKIMSLYAKVAQIFKERPNRIERAIRYSIKQYGLCNKEFISKAIDELVYGIAHDDNILRVRNESSVRMAGGTNVKE